MSENWPQRMRMATIVGVLAWASMIFASPVHAQRADDEDPYAQPAGRTTRTAGSQAATDAATRQDATPVDRYRADQIAPSTGTVDRQVTAPADRQVTAPTAGAVVDDQRTFLRPMNEFEKFVSQVADKPLRRFGSNLLVPTARGYSTPPTTTIPPDYRINPGDEIVIGLTGSVQATDMRLIVDSEGRVFIPQVGAVVVGGVRYGELQAVVSRQVSRQYRNFRAAVSIGRLHGITVYVTGFAATPGSYTLSSLSTLVNAVLAAGGPSGGGSFRSIQVRRGGHVVSDFDLYDFLLKGDKSADVVLHNDDVVFIAPAGPQVAVIGSVNAEAIYEARTGETTSSMLMYAGGVNTVADNTRLLVLDPLDGPTNGWHQLAPAETRTMIAKRGEIVRVLSDLGIARPLAQQSVLVTITGEVARPGHYYLPPNTTLANAIAQAGGLTTQAYPFASVFTRESVRDQQRRAYGRAIEEIQFLLTAQPLTGVSQNGLKDERLQAVQSVVSQLSARSPDGRVVLDIAPGSDSIPGTLPLENNDTLYVPNQPATVGVFGLVPNPSSFAYVPGRTIGDLVARAGGVQRIGDRRRLFVVRANGAILSARPGRVMLEQSLPGDLVFVPIDATRGEFWLHLRDLTSALFPVAVTAATVATVAK